MKQRHPLYLVKRAFNEGKTIRELALKKKKLPVEELEKTLEALKNGRNKEVK
jgi:aspartate ammonia-lyase